MTRIPRSYTGKHIVVAGGASGIGEELVRQLQPVATTIIILDRNASAGKKLVRELAPRVLFYQVDMADADTVTRTLRRVAKTVPTIDYFFNCAGSFLAGEIRDTPNGDWQAIFDSNILPIVNGTEAIYALMQKQKGGHIINIASAAGLFPVPVMSIYGATKAAVVNLTLGLRMEAKDFAINASVVCPTIVETPLYDTARYAGVDKPKALNLLKNRLRVQQPDITARKIITAVAKNRAVIHTSIATRLSWATLRLSVPLYLLTARRFFPLYRKTYRLKK